ncbi:SDR family NAD(P)-dependent oxidoreductase [Paenibacillus thermoaerophilus]|uniref:SDR family NAD(P)-dependent oxidoreductase n=1 Tax=Paenibacillus thermoaerophilus TaxID=1215385 RepID=A0ABW2V344_9BACL|nr:glucose 1-dehydrogenase [Paenibacillus thermoaerophilus]TMV11026.1 glucose 1-dehydrogenase [Paenibacillus thermoaerophilus]
MSQIQGINLQGTVALVTGASGGIGKATAIALAAAGAKVAVNYNRNEAGAREAVETIRAAGGQAEAFQADVTSLADIERLVSATEAAFGAPIGILVNNAGDMIRREANAVISEELYDRVMDLNLKSTVFVTKAVLPGMKRLGGGAIINMSSLAAVNGGGPGSSVYAASKAAVVAYSKGLAKELAGTGIRVNCVSPGFIGGTSFHATHTSEAARAATVGSIPLGREGKPEDVANVILFLASPLAGYLHGETIEINGGLYMR